MKKEGYMFGGSGPGSFWCAKCQKAHHKLSKIGEEHSTVKGFNSLWK